MAKLAVVGQDTSSLIDCSDVILPLTPPVDKPATFPATKSQADVQQACLASPFPSLSSDPAAVPTVHIRSPIERLKP
ncbi:hypothetical protein Clacol_010060 [Clathrus columnatus]|uniref:Fungal ligninase C-terminal domain-containing protein n=1 Tax=Clathrus columnatus TaxID=1419009 RepID=A0AAV5AM74_9AGAM|nr:hypothetical protein Clacol_010060 [Clathrus columnatus]